MQNRDGEIEFIVEKYTDLLLRFCAAKIREEVDRYDILQEVFIAYMKTNMEFLTETHRKNWLYKVASNKIDDFLKGHYKLTENELSDVFAENIECKDENLSFVEEIRKLPAKQGQTVFLYYYEGYSSDQIASILNVSPSTVRNNLDKARNNLKKMFTET